MYLFHLSVTAKYMVGIPTEYYNLCDKTPEFINGQTILSENKPMGILLSPTYPGMYPDNIYFWYRLRGHPGQRIKIHFYDFDLYFGGEQ